MYQPYTTQQKSISPTIALIRHVSTKKHITMDFPSGVALNAVYVNQFSREIVRESQIPFKGPITIHLVASGIQNCYHLVFWSEKRSQYLCSCYGFRQAGELHCPHTDMVNQQPVEGTVVQAAVESVTAEQEEAPERRTVAEWREIIRRGKERDKAELNVYWREVKLLQLQAQQSGTQTVF